MSIVPEYTSTMQRRRAHTHRLAWHSTPTFASLHPHALSPSPKTCVGKRSAHFRPAGTSHTCLISDRAQDKRLSVVCPIKKTHRNRLLWVFDAQHGLVELPSQATRRCRHPASESCKVPFLKFSVSQSENSLTVAIRFLHPQTQKLHGG